MREYRVHKSEESDFTKMQLCRLFIIFHFEHLSIMTTRGVPNIRPIDEKFKVFGIRPNSFDWTVVKKCILRQKYDLIRKNFNKRTVISHANLIHWWWVSHLLRRTEKSGVYCRQYRVFKKSLTCLNTKENSVSGPNWCKTKQNYWMFRNQYFWKDNLKIAFVLKVSLKV